MTEQQRNVEPQALARKIALFAEEKKASDIVVLDVAAADLVLLLLEDVLDDLDLALGALLEIAQVVLEAVVVARHLQAHHRLVGEPAEDLLGEFGALAEQALGHVGLPEQHLGVGDDELAQRTQEFRRALGRQRCLDLGRVVASEEFLPEQDQIGTEPTREIDGDAGLARRILLEGADAFVRLDAEVAEGCADAHPRDFLVGLADAQPGILAAQVHRVERRGQRRRPFTRTQCVREQHDGRVGRFDESLGCRNLRVCGVDLKLRMLCKVELRKARAKFAGDIVRYVADQSANKWQVE